MEQKSAYPPFKFLLIGAEGKLGRAIINELSSCNKNLQLLQGIGSPTSSLPTDPTPFLPLVDFILDVSTKEALRKNLPLFVNAKKPLIIGSTGHTDEDLTAIKKAKNHIPILLCPNFAPGIALLDHLLRALPPDLKGDISLIEAHHKDKKDTPSGTALHLTHFLPPRTKITFIREGNIIGEHTITISTPFEEITLSHKALDRKLFARGAIETAIKFFTNL